MWNCASHGNGTINKLWRASHRKSEIYDFITEATMKNYELCKSRIGLCCREVAKGAGWAGKVRGMEDISEMIIVQREPLE